MKVESCLYVNNNLEKNYYLRAVRHSVRSVVRLTRYLINLKLSDIHVKCKLPATTILRPLTPAL